MPTATLNCTIWNGNWIHKSFSSVFAENEREILMERTLAGMEAARARGRVGGRPKGLTKKSKELARLAATLYHIKRYTTNQICEQLKIGSKATFYNYLRHEGIEIEGWRKSTKP